MATTSMATLPPSHGGFLHTQSLPHQPPLQPPSPNSPRPPPPLPRESSYPTTTSLPVPPIPPRKPSDPTSNRPPLITNLSITPSTRPSPSHTPTPSITILPSSSSSPTPHHGPPSRASSPFGTLSAPLTPARSSARSTTPSTPRTPTGGGAALSFHALTHLYEHIVEQCECGVYTVRRLSSVLSKLCQQQWDYAQRVQKLLDAESAKHAEGFAQDHMRSCVAAWEQGLDTLRASCIHLLQLSARVSSEVVSPLNDLHAHALQRMAEVARDKKKADTEMAQAHSAVQTEHASCVRLLAQIDAMREDGKAFTSATLAPSSKPSSLLSKLQKKLEHVTLSTPAALNEKLLTQAGKYQRAIDAANARQQQYLQADLPAALSSLEAVERQRLSCMSQTLGHLAGVTEQWLPEERGILEGLCTASKAMSAEGDVRCLVQGFLHLHGPAPSATVYAYNLACSPADIRAGRYEGSNPNSAFHTTTAHALEVQPAICDGLRVPRVLAEAVAAVRRNDGLASEGIFRLSPSKAQFDEAKAAVESGDYSVLERCDAYVSAALIKDWLRSLTEPVIRDSLYEEAVAAAKASMAVGQGGSGGTAPGSAGGDVQVVFDKLEGVSQDVLRVVAAVVREATSGRNKSNKMSVSQHSAHISLAAAMLALTRR